MENKLGRGFWFWWLLATVGGTITGSVIFFVGLKPLVDAATQVEYGAFYRSVVGAVVGGFQWLVLRRTLDRAGWWVLATLFGWILFNELNFLNLFGAAPGIALIPDLFQSLIFGVILGVS